MKQLEKNSLLIIAGLVLFTIMFGIGGVPLLDPDERGLFPVLSMTDGVVEKKGWLPQGGYRLGIRSDGGIYYYYAHLSLFLSMGLSIIYQIELPFKKKE